MLTRSRTLPLAVWAFVALATVGCDDGEGEGNGTSDGDAGAAGAGAAGAGGTGGEGSAGAGGQAGTAASAGAAGGGGEGGQADALTDEALVALCRTRCVAQEGLDCLDLTTCEASCIGAAKAACVREYAVLLQCSASLEALDWGCVEGVDVPVVGEGTSCEQSNCDYVVCMDSTVRPPEYPDPTLYPQYEARCYR